jgi:hypothetical protein
MSPRARIAEAGLGAVLGITLGIGSLTFLALAFAIDLCRKGQSALRRPTLTTTEPKGPG